MTRTLARSAAAVAVCAALFAPAPAAAQPSPKHDQAAAEALFEAGRDLMEKGKYRAACKKFEASQNSEPAVGTVLNLANCYEKIGALASAWERFEEAAQQLSPGDDRLPVARSRAAALKPRLPRFVLTLDPDAPRGTRVFRDDTAVDPGALDVPIPVDPGPHRVVVKAPGHDDAQVSIDAVEGKVVKRRLFVGPAGTSSLGDTAAPAPVPPPVSAPETPGTSWWSGRRIGGVVLGGVGVTGLAVGFGMGGVALAQKSIVSQHCDATKRTCDSTAALDAASTGRTASTVSTVSVVIGAAALAGGVVLLVIGAPAGSDAAPPPAAPSATLRGAVLPGGGAFTLSGVF